MHCEQVLLRVHIGNTRLRHMKKNTDTWCFVRLNTVILFWARDSSLAWKFLGV